jgi:hypothetical protein
VGGFYFYSSSQRQPAPQVVAPPKTDPTPPPPVTPPAPATTVVKFGSEPPGAEVVRTDTGEVLGHTPFQASFPSGKTRLQFTFRKASYGDVIIGVVPEVSTANLDATLSALPPPPVEQPVAKAAASKTRPPRGTATTKVRVKSPKPVDDPDAVMAPKF